MNKNLLLILIFTFTFRGIFAQNDSEVSNLYEYGEPVLACEDNLENFFRNFPLYIDNAKEFRLINYEYTGVIKNQKQARRYVKKNFEGLALCVWSVSGDDQSEIRLKSCKSIDKDALLKSVKDYSLEFVKTGYHVYSLKFVFEFKTYIYYVFVNPENKQVVAYGNLFGFDIPVKHFIFHQDAVLFSEQVFGEPVNNRNILAKFDNAGSSGERGMTYMVNVKGENADETWICEGTVCDIRQMGKMYQKIVSQYGKAAFQVKVVITDDRDCKKIYHSKL